MTAYNIVRFRVKPGRDADFIAVHKSFKRESMAGFRKGAIIKTGEHTYCFFGEWSTMADIVAARPQMIANLDRMRDMLEDLGGGLGVTDPVSGEAVLELP